MNSIILSLLVAIHAVESSCGTDPRAFGNEYQITPVCVKDVNRIYGTRYSWPRDVRNSEKSKRIIVLYLTHYGIAYRRETGRIPTSETLARIYHLGYAGFMRGDARGDAYWRKIRRRMK